MYSDNAILAIFDEECGMLPTDYCIEDTLNNYTSTMSGGGGGGGR